MPYLPGLKRARIRHLLTIRELAAAARVTPTTIVDLEKGRAEARISTVRKLVEALGVSANELLDEPPRDARAVTQSRHNATGRLGR